MSLVYRAALTLTRRHPYVDWANKEAKGDGVRFPAGDVRTVYLVSLPGPGLTVATLIDEFWPDVFEEELAAWTLDEAAWPSPRTREMFDTWFVLEFTETVIDLVPDEPLSVEDVEAADVAHVFSHCGWCDLELALSEGRRVSFAVEDRRALADHEGLALVLPTGDGYFVSGIVSAAESDGAKAGEDLIFRACSSRCEKLIRKHVPRALRRLGTA
jgi:hypothetical protein